MISETSIPFFCITKMEGHFQDELREATDSQGLVSQHQAATLDVEE